MPPDSKIHPNVFKLSFTNYINFFNYLKTVVYFFGS